MLALPTLDELAKYVHRVLCQRGDLDDATPMVDVPLYRQGSPCGMEYLLLAPRAVRLSAIWAAAENRILFYDADLTRFQVTQVQGPDPTAVAARPKSAARLQWMWKGK